jgi:hypothetical protein
VSPAIVFISRQTAQRQFPRSAQQTEEHIARHLASENSHDAARESRPWRLPIAAIQDELEPFLRMTLGGWTVAFQNETLLTH